MEISHPCQTRQDRPGLRPLRVLLFGMRCAFSVPALRALIGDRSVDLRAVVLPGAPSPSGREQEHAIDRLSRGAGVPVVELDRMRGMETPQPLAALARLAPDAIVVTCFPRKISAEVRALAPLGGVNVHPSLLPGLRGPEPVFWTLRRGDRQTGVSLHLLDDGFDTGPILAQRAVEVPFGVRGPDMEARLAEIGAALLGPTLRDLASGRIAPRPQDDRLASSAPIPGEQDWVMPTDLPAMWAYGFARGVAPLGGPLAVLVMRTGERIPIADATAVDAWGTLDGPTRRDDDLLTVRFRPGTATFTLRA